MIPWHKNCCDRISVSFSTVFLVMALANAVALKVGLESTLKSLEIGDLAVNEGNIEKGLGIFQSILEIEPENVEIFFPSFSTISSGK